LTFELDIVIIILLLERLCPDIKRLAMEVVTPPSIMLTGEPDIIPTIKIKEEEEE